MPSFHMPKFSTQFSYFLFQVHQPFFMLGIVNALISMLLFLLAYKGIIVLHVTPLDMHSFSLFYLVFTQFFIGFIFTTYPRFTGQPPISKGYYLALLSFCLSGSLLFYMGITFLKLYLALSLLLFLASFFMILLKLHTLYAASKASKRDDPFYILLGFYFGGMGLIWYALYFYGFVPSGATFVFYPYFIYVTLSVAQRMVPFFSHSHASKNELFTPIVLGGLFLKVFALTFAPSLNAPVDILLGGYIFYEFWRWHVDFKSAPAILKILHIALAWFVFAFLFGGLFELIALLMHHTTMQLQLHLFALGFVTVMLVGFGTRVALGHSGQPPHANSFIVKLFYLLNIVVVMRIVFSLFFTFDMNLFWLFDLSVTLFILLFLSWAWKFAPVLLWGEKISQ